MSQHKTSIDINNQLSLLAKLVKTYTTDLNRNLSPKHNRLCEEKLEICLNCLTNLNKTLSE